MSHAKFRHRQLVLSNRRSFTEQYVAEVSMQIGEQLKSLSVWEKRQCLHVYLPIPGQNEIDTWQIVDWLLSNGHQVWTSYLPVDEDKDGFCRLTKNTVYGEGRYSIPLPEAAVHPTVDPDVVVVPCLSVDGKGNRLGYGSGWYDWFLKKHPRAIRIGLCYDQFTNKKLPHDERDQKLDMIITEKQIIRCERSV